MKLCLLGDSSIFHEVLVLESLYCHCGYLSICLCFHPDPSKTSMLVCNPRSRHRDSCLMCHVAMTSQNPLHSLITVMDHYLENLLAGIRF